MVRFSLRIIIPTIPRDGKYLYLQRTVDSIGGMLHNMNVDYSVFAFSRSSIVPAISDPNFHFVQIPDLNTSSLEYPKMNHNDPKHQKILRQNLDWVAMMSEWKKTCYTDEVYLYLEDDFTVCQNSETHIISLFYWALKHQKSWKSIRMGFGFSGLFMQCRDTESYLQHVWEKCLNPESDVTPVDYSLAEYWTSLGRPTDRQHYTFRYNLFDHIGAVSTVGNEADTNWNPKCFDAMNHYFNFYFEKFNVNECSAFMMSPCYLKDIQSDLIYHDRDTFLAKSFLAREDRLIVFDKIGGQIVGRQRVRGWDLCDTICKDVGLQCKTNMFPFVNNCDELKARVNCKYNTCISNRWGVWWGYYLPIITQDMECLVSDIPVMKCDQEILDIGPIYKICPCVKRVAV
jgi:hypothetical protein